MIAIYNVKIALYSILATVTEEEVAEVCADMDVTGEDLDAIRDLAKYNAHFSYDKLISVIREIKRTGASVEKAVETMSLGGMPWFLYGGEPEREVEYKIFFDNDKTDYAHLFRNDDMQEALECFFDGSNNCTNDVRFKREYRDQRDKFNIEEFDLEVNKESIVSVDKKTLVIKARVRSFGVDNPEHPVKYITISVDLSTYQA